MTPSSSSILLFKMDLWCIFQAFARPADSIRPVAAWLTLLRRPLEAQRWCREMGQVSFYYLTASRSASDLE